MSPGTAGSIPLAHSPPYPGAPGDPYSRHVAAVRQGVRERAEAMLGYATAPPAGLLEAIDTAAAFHDLGKLDLNTQATLKAGRGGRLRWDHIDAGVAYLTAKPVQDWPAAWLVRAHHAPGLPQNAEHFDPDGLGRRLRGRRHDDDDPQRHEEQIARTDACLAQYLGDHEAAVGPYVTHRQRPIHGLPLRLALSCLVDADHTDTAFFDTGRLAPKPPEPRWAERLDSLCRYVRALPPGESAQERQRNRLRSNFFEACLQASSDGSLVACEGPVGLGKTTAVAAYLLRRALQDKTILFCRFDAIPANDRYGRFGANSFPVSQELADQLAAALRALTVPSNKGKTWRSLPGEAPKQYDLLLAFVEAAPDAPVASLLAEDDEGADLSSEASEAGSGNAESIAAFEKRAERLIDAVKAKVGADFTKTPVWLAVFRKLDPANRKVIYSGEMPVKDYYRAAMSWRDGERNVPPWLALPVRRKGEHAPLPMAPPHVAPLGVIAFSRQSFVRGGVQQQEVVGLPAAEAMALFLEEDRRRVGRVLRLLLARRSALISCTAHVRRRHMERKREFELRWESLRTVTLMGVLLHKLGREDYMNDTAFKLGQLLAAADVVHAGYCADVRGGAVPPSLLGNQVFAMAQTAPIKALATLCRRWKPYDGWAKKTARDAERLRTMKAREDKSQRDWDILVALRHAREIRPLADELGPVLTDCVADDVFRAELLLGYLAGLPRAQKYGGIEED